MNNDFKVLLISSNKFYIGLLEGYCHANQFSLTKIELTELIASPRAIEKQQDLIILDMPDLRNSPKEGLEVLQSLKLFSMRHKTPICAIGGGSVVPELKSGSDECIDAYFMDPLELKKIDAYIKDKFNLFSKLWNQERRRNERRRLERRSIDQDLKIFPSSVNAKSVARENGYCCQVGHFRIDSRIKAVFLGHKNLELTRKEFDLFELLASDSDRVFLTEEIIDYLWPENDRATKSDLYQYMHLLRKKIEKDPENPKWIMTIKGFGYKLGKALPLIEDKIPTSFNKGIVQHVVNNS